MTDNATTLLLTVAVDIDPAHVADFREAVDELTRTAAAEPGVLDYWVGQELGSPNRFVFVERYADHAALEEHQSTEACRAYVAALPGWLARPTEAVVESATSQATIKLEPALESGE